LKCGLPALILSSDWTNTLVNKQEANRCVENYWKDSVQRRMGCPVFMDNSLTEQYSWGWIFYFVASEPEKCQTQFHKEGYACDRETGISLPVATKGLEFTLSEISVLKERERSE
jgi:hypothetical protein